MPTSWFTSGPQVSLSFKTFNHRFPRIDSMNVRDDTEIDWKLIPDPDWNLWSAHTLQRRWLTLKNSIKGHEDMTHKGEIHKH